MKSSLTDDAVETEVRLVLTGHESVDEVRDLVRGPAEHERGPAKDGDDRLVDFFAVWPRPVLTGSPGWCASWTTAT